jgi:Nucleotidyltransferase domain
MLRCRLCALLLRAVAPLAGFGSKEAGPIGSARPGRKRSSYRGYVDQEVQRLVDELARRPEVLGVALFGSVARGDARPESDVDVFVLVKEGVWRDVEKRGQRNFEFVFSSPQSTQAFGEKSPDEYVKMWHEAQILLDKEGRIAELRRAAGDLRARGKPPPDERSIRHRKFDAADQLRSIRGLQATDLPAAALVLHRHVEALTELFFDLTQQWTPPPKERLKKIRELDPAVAEAFDRFYGSVNLDEKMQAAGQVVQKLFEAAEVSYCSQPNSRRE